MGKKPSISAATKQRLQQAFWDLYKCKKLEQISIKEITELAGVNRGTFYLYYKDIYDILSQIEEQLLPDLPFLSNNTHISFVDYITTAAESFLSHRDYLIVLLGDHGDKHFQDTIRIGLRDFYQQIISPTYVGTPKGELMLDYCTAGTMTVLWHWLSEEPTLPLPELLQLFGQLLSPCCSADVLEHLQNSRIVKSV